MDEVETQIGEELQELEQQYRDTLTRGATEAIPRDVLTAALNRISAMIDQKSEQLRLIRDARRELAAVARTDGYRGDAPRITIAGMSDAADKSVQRSLLVNELRAMQAESALKS